MRAQHSLLHWRGINERRLNYLTGPSDVQLREVMAEHVSDDVILTWPRPVRAVADTFARSRFNMML